MSAQQYVMTKGMVAVHHPEQGVFRMNEGVPTPVPDWALEAVKQAGATLFQRKAEQPAQEPKQE